MVHCKLCASDEIWFAYLITVVSKVEVKILQRSEQAHFPLGSQHSCFAHWLILPALPQLMRVTQRWAYPQATTKTKEKPVQDCVSGLVYPEELFYSRFTGRRSVHSPHWQAREEQIGFNKDFHSCFVFDPWDQKKTQHINIRGTIAHDRGFNVKGSQYVQATVVHAIVWNPSTAILITCK